MDDFGCRWLFTVEWLWTDRNLLVERLTVERYKFLLSTLR